MGILTIALVAALAFFNGANDNAKGVATLVGYGAATPRRAMAWATGTTALGAAASFWLAHGLLASFSGGLLFGGHPQFAAGFWLAVLCGACAWVAFATYAGLPVSTTHAITGALVGAGAVGFGVRTVQWGVVGMKFSMPLALSPLLSLALVYVIAWPVGAVARRVATRCACVVEPAGLMSAGAASVSLPVGVPSFVMGATEECRGAGAMPIATGLGAANVIHWASAGLVGFARGWNDAPKIAALGIGALAATSSSGANTAAIFALVTLAMAVGGMVADARVLTTLATKVTTLPLAESLAASVTTSVLVALASWRGLPVSTTHVSTGAIVGAGLRHDPRGVKWKKVGEIGISWLVTIPVTVAVAAGVALVAR